MKSIEHYEQLAREAKGEGCGHIGPAGKSWGTWWRDGIVTNEDDGHVFACMWCGEVLPFGPATDTAEVLVEIRAAEIAASLPSERISGRNLSDCTDGAEYAGWLEHLYDSAKLPVQIGEHAGWLARAIWNHDAEQAETGGEG